MRALQLAVIGALVALAPPAAAGPGEELGRAYRAYEAGEFEKARSLAGRIDRNKLINDDYLLHLRAQSAYALGRYDEALAVFRELARMGESRFKNRARWREGDVLWAAGRHREAAGVYENLIRSKASDGDPALAQYRLARAAEIAGKEADAIRRYRQFRASYPAHEQEPEAARRLLSLGGAKAVALSSAERLQRGIVLTDAKKWHEAIDEIAQIEDKEVSGELELRRDFWKAMTLFKRRRHYKLAGDILLRIYKRMGPRADEALFHGARALSRADFDKDAIRWYQRVVAEYPRSEWAPEAQYLSGWLEFNLGNYELAIPYLRDMRKRYRKSRWADEALWYHGYSLYLLGRYDDALPHLDALSKMGHKEVGGKGRYWKARALDGLKRQEKANAIYRDLVGRFPFSWYALLSRARLAERGVDIGIFGDSPRDPKRAPPLADRPSTTIKRDPLLARADELVRAGLAIDGGYEIRRREAAFRKRHRRSRAVAMTTLLDAYKRALNFNRAWMLSLVVGGRSALDAEPTGDARRWWQHAYPMAFDDLIERHRGLGKLPKYFLNTIMRKESGFNPHTHSHADARGLLQMIPPTTKRVVVPLRMTYWDGMLFVPELNIQTASWYIGRLYHKFKQQIPLAAASYNAGPRAMMRWLQRNPGRPVDEFAELVSYNQARNYLKRTTETYARYLYLYEKEVYEQPLTVDYDYVVDEIIY